MEEGAREETYLSTKQAPYYDDNLPGIVLLHLHKHQQ